MIVINVFAFLSSTIKKKHFFDSLSTPPSPRIPILRLFSYHSGTLICRIYFCHFQHAFRVLQFIHCLQEHIGTHFPGNFFFQSTMVWPLPIWTYLEIKLPGFFFINPAMVPVLLPVHITNDDRETKILFSQIFSCCKASYCTATKTSSLL